MSSFQLSVAEVIAITQPLRQTGAFSGVVTGVAPIEHGREGDLCFLENNHYVSEMVDKSYEKFLATTSASVLMVPESFPALEPKPNQLFLFVKKPSLAFAQVCGRIERLQWPRPSPGIHPSAVVDRDAKVHPSVHIGPLCVVGPRAEIHKGAIIHSGSIVRAHATVGIDSEIKSRVMIGEDCIIGERCILHSGVVIGSDGYGYVFSEGKHVKVPQIGNVVIEDDVEIGANTTIDRARFGSTRIGQGTKIDNLVQVAHNVVVGKHCLLVAQCVIGGGTVLEDYVILGGQSGVGGHVRIGAQSKIAGGAGVARSLEPKSTVTGNPAMDFNKAYRIEALKRKLPELFKRVQALEENSGITQEENGENKK